MYETGAREPGADVFLRLITATGARIDISGSRRNVDCYRNSEIFTSLASVLTSVPIKESGPLEFPAAAWKRSR